MEVGMTDVDLYSAYNYTQEEVDLLREHDENEDLHAYISKGEEPSHLPADETNWWQCKECGDDASGLMHNNTWRNVEPLMEDDGWTADEWARDQAERSGNSSANWGFSVGY
jgi:hypothetical protein